MSFYIDTSWPEDSESQFTDSRSTDKDSQLTIAKGYVRSVSPSISTSLNPPPNVSSMRQQGFDLVTPLTWTGEEYDTYWPFLDNIWVHKHSEKKTKRNTVRSHYWCSFWGKKC